MLGVWHHMCTAALDRRALLAVLVVASPVAPVAFATIVATIVAPVCICQNTHAHTKAGLSIHGRKRSLLFSSEFAVS